ncbi:MAG: OmpA family protein [Legionellaceae bacterium]|nr:OmpA family protein [Legionellaceae bacterium]
MKLSGGLKTVALLTGAILLAACSKHPANLNGLPDEDVMAHGLGNFTHFPGQEPGESYSTKAPTNQRYLFAYDDATLASKYEPSLQAQASYLKGHPGAKVLLAGYTDERGSREYNIALGEHRANAVQQLLRSWGAQSYQLRVVSYGKERPLCVGHGGACHRQNRRVELMYEVAQ